VGAWSYLDTADTELNKGAQHLSASDLISGSADGALHEQTVVVRLNICVNICNITIGYAVHSQ